MRLHTLWIIFIYLLLKLKYGSGGKCGPEFHGKCLCGETDYQGRTQFVVNCTDTGFKETSMLEHLPDEIQVLIFTGNSIPELPWNVFGTLKNYTHLKVVDMSNNGIHEILGKSYHRVTNVERLILNHNEISISSGDGSVRNNHHHPRIFSNFINLLELHLTNAFADETEDLASDLHDIFVNSNLTKLIKLHLEQNEITRFKDARVFCDLPSLMDLHLGNNLLTGVDFNILCLKQLRYLDLEANKITQLSAKQLGTFDMFMDRNQSFAIDLGGNPFTCDCAIYELFVWLQTTNVTVRNKDKLRCFHGDPEVNSGKTILSIRKVKCDPKTLSATSAQHEATAIVLILLTIILISLLAAVVYMNRISLKQRLNPILNTVSRKVYYTSIGRQDDQEIDV